MSEQIFSCQNCGFQMKMKPPKTDCRIMNFEPCKGEPEEHNTSSNVECENCHDQRTVYWCSGWHDNDKDSRTT